jgi:dTMP kinase
MSGRFITFEGGEGAGKSSHASALVQRLRGLGIAVVQTREPGGSPGAEIIRHVLLSGAAQPLGPDAEAILFAAARADHVTSLIAPALKQGRWVICDRFIDSTRVYQGVLGHVDLKLIHSLERVSIGQLRPELTFILDVPAEVGLARAKNRRGDAAADRFEDETLEYHQKLRAAYVALAAREPDRCVVIDTTEPRASVATRIWTAVTERLDPATAPVAGLAS